MRIIRKRRIIAPLVVREPHHEREGMDFEGKR